MAVETIDLTEEEASDTTLANGQTRVGRDKPLPLPVPISARVERVANRVQASLDLKRGPLLRLVLFDLGNGRASRLLVAIHHLAVDGISWRVLISDLLVAMTQLRKGEPIMLPAKTASFQRWALHVQELARSASLVQRERAYWLGVVQRPMASLPVELVESGSEQGSGSAQGTGLAQGLGSAQGTTPTEPCNTGASARTVSVALTREETRLLLQEALRPYRSHIQELLLVPLLQTLARWMGTQTIRLDLEGHGREELGGLDVSRTVGWFTSLYPVLFNLPEDDGLQPLDRQERAFKGRYLEKDEGSGVSAAACPCPGSSSTAPTGQGQAAAPTDTDSQIPTPERPALSVPTAPARSPYESWIKTIKEQLRAVPHKGIGYGLLRYLCEDRELREQLASATPSQVIFNYLGQFDQMAVNSTLTEEAIQATLESIGVLNGPENQRSYLLEVDGLVIGGQLHLRWTYSEQFHRQTTIDALAQEFLQALRDLLDHCLSPEAGGLTPSDFPLASLDQATLDRLLASRSHRTGSGQGQAAAPTSSYGPDGQAAAPTSSAGPNGVEDLYPLTPLQQGLLFHTLSAPQSGIYIEQVSCTLRGEIEVGALERAWQRVIMRYAILRTAFVWQELSEPLQIVFPQAKLPTHILDWRSRSQEQQGADLEAFLYADRTEGFDLDQAPLMRVTLVRLSETCTQMILTHHHLLLDGWSQSRLLQEVLACFEAEMQGLSLEYEEPRPYRDYVSWLAEQNNEEAKTYWQQVLAGIVAPTPLLVDRNGGKGASPTFTAPLQEYQSERIYAEEALQIDAVTTANWQVYVRQEHVTLNTLVQAAWALVLSRYSGQADVVFGNVVAGRPPELAGVERMIGLFINTVPVRVQVQDEEEVGVWLRQLQRQQSEQRSYEYCSLVQVQGWSEVPREHTLFESLFVFENYPVQAALAGQKDRLQVDAVQVIEQTNYPLTISVHPGTEVSLKVNYDRQRFEPATIERLLGHLKMVLEQFVADPERRLIAVSLLTEREREQLLVQWNATEIPIRPDLCVHQLFEQQVEQTPDSVALVFEDELLTYAVLNRRANQLAHYLQGLGVGPDVLVGICLERSIGMVVGLLAVLKAGSAYVPLDPIYPQERLAYMIQEAQVAVLLTQSHLQERLRAGGITIVAVDIEIEGPEDNPVSAVQPDHLAYMIYTSGSTGKPKGVMNTHRGLCNRLLWMQQAYQLTYEDRILQKTPFGFDVSVWEFFWPLLTGASLIIASPGGHQDPTYLRTLIARQQVTTVHFVPSMLQAFLWSESTYGTRHTGYSKANLESRTSLRQVICSGEALSVELQAHFFAHFAEQVQLHNLYGPTEAAIDVTFWECQHDRRDSALRLSDSGRVPIGRPIANTQIYLLDANLQPVPIGIPGELYIGGVGLARGYFERPDLTAEKFIANPFGQEGGERLYRTGDLARYRADGAIEFLGRIDQQVKLRGFRIELGEIEATLREHSRVQDAVVVLCEEDEARKYLAAYVVSAGSSLEPLEEQPRQEELQNYLRGQLPDYMVPASLSLQTLPL